MDTLLSIFVPNKIRRYKNMSPLFAFTILIVAAFLLCLPVRINSNKLEKVLKTNGYYCNDLYTFETEFCYSDMLMLNPQIEDDVFTCAPGGPDVFTLTSTEGKKLYVVFDKDFNDFKYSRDLYSAYSITKAEDTLVFLFAKEIFILGTVNSKLEYITVAYDEYSSMPISLPSYVSTTEFLQNIGIHLAELYSKIEISAFTLQSISLVILVPLILILVVWLLLKKTGEMKTFKEYLNIAGICTIAPTILFFIIGFFTESFMVFYTTVFVLYYLFVVYKINITKEN